MNLKDVRVNIRTMTTVCKRCYTVYAVQCTGVRVGQVDHLVLVGEGLSRPEWVPMKRTYAGDPVFRYKNQLFYFDDFKPVKAA